MKVTLRPQPGPQTEFLSTTADIAIYGGAAGGGKTYGLLLDTFRHIYTPGYRELILRRTTPEVMNQGGLWEESVGLFLKAQAIPMVGKLTHVFPSGARCSMGHMEHEKDKYKYQGAQIAVIKFDELTHFTESQFWYMLSRNRSASGVTPYIRATCNPDADSWVTELVGWWIDPLTGYAIPERSGVLRWIVRHEDQILQGGSEAECRELAIAGGMPEELIEPRSLTFIPAKLSDNPALTAKDPGYAARLALLPRVERERLLGANWKIRSTDGAEWGDELFSDVFTDYWPDQFSRSAIGIDPAKGKKRGDYSAAVFAGVSNGKLWVDSVVEKMPADRLAAAAVSLFQQYQPDAIGIESNANQELAFGELIKRHAEAAGIGVLPMLPIANTRSKSDRIYRLGPYINQNLLRIRRGGVSNATLENQLRGFPLPTVHDDGPDALEMAVRTIQMTAGQRGPEWSASEMHA